MHAAGCPSQGGGRACGNGSGSQGSLSLPSCLTSPKGSLGSRSPAQPCCTLPGPEHVPWPLFRWVDGRPFPKGPCSLPAALQTSAQRGSTEHPLDTQHHPNVLGQAAGNSSEKCSLGNPTAPSATVWDQEVDFSHPQGQGQALGQFCHCTAICQGQKQLSAASPCCKSALLSTSGRISLRPGPRRSAREPFRDSNSSERLSSQLEIMLCFFCIHPVVLFLSSCAFRFLFPPSRRFPFFFPLEFFLFLPLSHFGF